LENELRYELAWLERDLKRMRDLGPLSATLAPIEALQADAFEMLKNWITDPKRRPNAAADQAKQDLRKESQRFLSILREILDLRSELLVLKDPYPTLGKDVNALLTPHFMRTTPLERFWDLPRYLKAIRLRAEKWKKNPQKDAERAKQLAPYLSAPPAVRWLVEEFRVSLFAQELGTSEPISAVKLDEAIKALNAQSVAANAAASKPPPKPEKAVPVVIRLDPVEGKGKPLKSLSNLDKFFTR